MIEYRVTKYDPAHRDSTGVYFRDEWTSVSDIGRELGRRYRRLLIDAGVLVSGGIALYCTIRVTALYCFLHGVDLPPCFIGCAH
jgi:hypothetical protein